MARKCWAVRDNAGATVEIEWVEGGALLRSYTGDELEDGASSPPFARFTNSQSRWLAECLLKAAGIRYTLGDKK